MLWIRLEVEEALNVEPVNMVNELDAKTTLWVVPPLPANAFDLACSRVETIVSRILFRLAVFLELINTVMLIANMMANMPNTTIISINVRPLFVEVLLNRGVFIHIVYQV